MASDNNLMHRQLCINQSGSWQVAVQGGESVLQEPTIILMCGLLKIQIHWPLYMSSIPVGQLRLRSSQTPNAGGHQQSLSLLTASCVAVECHVEMLLHFYAYWTGPQTAMGREGLMTHLSREPHTSERERSNTQGRYTPSWHKNACLSWHTVIVPTT